MTAHTPELSSDSFQIPTLFRSYGFSDVLSIHWVN